jgi:hypothetical protein
MDSGQQSDEAQMLAYIKDCQQTIKTRMPNTYKSVLDESKKRGKDVVAALVSDAIRGKPNCFYAWEAGYVMGAPFNMPNLTGELAAQIVGFGVKHMVCWALPVSTEGVAHGTN